MRNVVQLFLAANTILLMHKWNHARSLLVDVISVITPGRQRALTAFRRYYLLKNKLSNRMIKQLLNLVIAKYRDLSIRHVGIYVQVQSSIGRTAVACRASVSARVRRESWDESEKKGMRGEEEGGEGNACPQTPRFWKTAFAHERSFWLVRCW